MSGAATTAEKLLRMQLLSELALRAARLQQQWNRDENEFRALKAEIERLAASVVRP